MNRSQIHDALARVHTPAGRARASALLTEPWITPAFNAADFVGLGAMTWTLQSSDVTAMKYHVVGHTITVAFGLQVTTVGGTLNNQLLIKNGQWGGFSSVGGSVIAYCLIIDNGVRIQGGIVQSGGPNLAISKADATNFAASTNATYAFGSITFDIA